jgi:hypothetical protein
MTKHFFITVVAIAAALLSRAQKLDSSQVPAAVKISFVKQYPGVKAKWEKENGQYEASFKKEAKQQSVLYTAAGMLTETETDIRIDALPSRIVPYVKAHYKNAAVKEASRIVKAGGGINYEAGINKLDLLFDEKGNFIRAVKD